MAIKLGIGTIEGHVEPLPHNSKEIIHGSGSVYDAIMALSAVSSTGFIFDCGTTVAVGSVVYFDGTKLMKAKANASGTVHAVGVAVELPSAGKARVLSLGLTNEIFTGLTPGADYWLSWTTVGLLSTTPPVQGSGMWAKYIGQAFTDTRMLVNTTRVPTYRPA
jgi:hypothetical protein